MGKLAILSDFSRLSIRLFCFLPRSVDVRSAALEWKVLCVVPCCAVLPEIDFHRLAVLAVGKGRRVACMVLCACFIEVVCYQRLTFRRLNCCTCRSKGRRVACMVLCACFIEVVCYQRLTFRRLNCCTCRSKGRRVVCKVLCACFIEVVSYCSTIWEKSTKLIRQLVPRMNTRMQEELTGSINYFTQTVINSTTLCWWWTTLRVTYTPQNNWRTNAINYNIDAFSVERILKTNFKI